MFSSLPQPLLAIPAFVFVDAFATVLPAGLGFAAGAMAWMVAIELAPEALRETRPLGAATAVALAFMAMLAFQALALGL